jgi:methionine--tRNA ligase beta chain
MIKSTLTFPDFVKLDLRVGTITQAIPVDGSERLVKLTIDLGEEIGTREIIAGIALTYTPEMLTNRQIIVIVNLEPKKMMGMESNGMVLAAGDSEIALLQPDKPLPNGTVVR